MPAPASKVVCLVSGGTDSPVAARLLMERGCHPIFVYCDNHPFADEGAKRKALRVIEKLVEGEPGRFKVYLVPHGQNLADIMRNCPRRLTCVLCRRTMYRIAKAVAEREGAIAIATGEILGEHASQTLENLAAETQAVEGFCVLRPLIGLNKTEVEQLARKAGTFELSAAVGCCTATPRWPSTRVEVDRVVAAERNLDVGGLVERSLAGATAVELGGRGAVQAGSQGPA